MPAGGDGRAGHRHEDGLRLTEAEAERIKNVDQSVYAYPLRADGTIGERRRRLVS